MEERYAQVRAVLERSMRTASASALMSTVRALEKRVGGWDGCTDEEMRTVVERAPRVLRYRLRRVLTAMYTQRDGLLRWPSLFGQCGCGDGGGGGGMAAAAAAAHGRRVSMVMSEEAALPLHVYRLPEDSAIRKLFSRLYSELVQATGARSVLTVRNSLTFLYGFLFGTKDKSLLPEGAAARTDPDALVDFLLRQTPDDVSRAYATYRSTGSLIHVRTTLATLSTHLRLLTFFFRKVLRSSGWTHDGLTLEHFGIGGRRRGRRKKATAAAAAADDDDEGSVQSSVSQGGNGGGRQRFSLRVSDSQQRLMRFSAADWIVPGDRIGGGGGGGPQQQHYFHADEIRRLYLACETLFEKLLFTALFTTGMRRKGFARADASAILARRRRATTTTTEPDDWDVGPAWWTYEKRGVRVCYTVSPALAGLLRQWAAAGNTDSTFVFPSVRTQRSHRQQQQQQQQQTETTCVSGSHLFRTFKRVARRAGVSGPHVHPHTTRHTVAWTLSALGNSVEDIASFVHHKSPEVTNNVYIRMTREQRMGRMTCPWLSDATAAAASGGGSGHGAAQSMEDAAWDMAEAIASPFLSPDQKTFPTLRSRRRPSSSLPGGGGGNHLPQPNTTGAESQPHAGAAAAAAAATKQERRERNARLNERLDKLLASL